MKSYDWSVLKILLPVFFLFAHHCIAQVEKEGLMISVSAGSCIPLGNFAKKSPGHDGAGYANPGYFVGYSFTFYNKDVDDRNYGLFFFVYGQIHQTDHRLLIDHMSQQEPGGGTIIDGIWRMTGGMLGAYWVKSITKNLYFEPRFAIGLTQVISPEFIAINLFGPPEYPWQIHQNKSDVNFQLSYLCRPALRYDILEDTQLLAYVDFFAVNPRFSNVETNTSMGTITNTFQQNIRTVNFGIGIGLTF